MSSNSRRVLVVDNHRSAATALLFALRLDGRMTALGPAATLAEALQMAPDADAVILDMNLSDSEGIDTVLRFRAHQPTLPMVVYSADPEPARRVHDGHLTVVLPKGEVNKLLDALADLLDLPPRSQ